MIILDTKEAVVEFVTNAEYWQIDEYIETLKFALQLDSISEETKEVIRETALPLVEKMLETKKEME